MSRYRKTEDFYRFRMYNKFDSFKNSYLFPKDILDNGLYFSLIDIEMNEYNINTIYFDFETKDKSQQWSVGSEIIDLSRNLIKVMPPLYILANSGEYTFQINVSFNMNGGLVQSARNTFRISESININDELIQKEGKYPILNDLINRMSGIYPDLSKFITYDEVAELVKEASINVATDEVLREIESKNYVNVATLESYLKSYQTLFGMSEYAKSSTLNGYLKVLDFNKRISNYTDTIALKEMLKKYITNEDFDYKMSNFITNDTLINKLSEILNDYITITSFNNSLKDYIPKETGKGLSTNDFTDALKNKLDNLSNYDDTLLKSLITERLTKEEVDIVVKGYNYVDRNYVDNKVLEVATNGVELTSENIIYDKNNENLNTVGKMLTYLSNTIASNHSDVNGNLIRLEQNLESKYDDVTYVDNHLKFYSNGIEKKDFIIKNIDTIDDSLSSLDKTYSSSKIEDIVKGLNDGKIDYVERYGNILKFYSNSMLKYEIDIDTNNDVSINDMEPSLECVYSSSKVNDIVNTIESSISDLIVKDIRLDDDITDLDNRLGVVENTTSILKQNSIVLTSENGTKYILKVRDNGELYVEQIIQ